MTQRLFPDFGSQGLREARLVFKSPEKAGESRGEKMRENLEKFGPRYAEVIKHLRDAASFAGDANLARLLEDPETQQMIAAQVELPPGELTKKWLNAIAIVFLRKAHEAFRSEEGEVRGWKDKTTDQAKKCAEIFRATVTEIDAAKKLYGEELPGFSGADGMKLLTLLRRGADQPKLKEKFDRLIDLQKEILWADETALAKTDVWKAKLKDVGIGDAALVRIDATTDPTARRKLLLELVQSAAGVLTAAEQDQVRGAIGKIDEALTRVDDERKAHLMRRFPERLKYLYRLGGSDMEAVVENAIARDGKFSFDVFETNLRELMGAKLDAGSRRELLRILGLATDKERKVVTEDAIKKAAEYLCATLRLNNPTGISLSALALRARLPQAAANELAESKLQVGLGTLIEMAQKINALAAGPVSDPVEKYLESVLLDSKQINGKDRKVLKDKAKFMEIVGFLLYGDGANPLERGTKAAQAAEKFWKDTIGDPGLVETIDGTGVVKEGSEPALTAALKTLQVTVKAAEWHKAMRDGGIHELTWKDTVKQYASELGTTAAAAAPIWWDYIKSIPRNFWDSEGDPALRTILDRRKGLEQGKAALESLLSTSNGAQELLKKSEVGLGHLKAAQEQAIRGDAVTSPRDNIEQARALLMANQYVIGQLNTLGWSMRSKRLRQLTLWMSLLKYKNVKGDPEKGLNEAKQLLQKTAALVTPEQQDAFVDTWIKENPADKEAFLGYTDARALVENQEGRDMTAPLKQRGLTLRPRALELLRQTKDPANPVLNLAANVGRWLMDPPEKVSASLAIVLEDSPAKAAFVTAFITGAEQTYVHQGRTEKVTVADARMAVDVVQQRLLFEMRGSIKAREQIEDEDEFTNPIDRWLRTGVESIKELWNTDMVGKAEVIAILFAAYWMIKEAWKSKKGKFALVGFATLLGANAIIKQRTGRDLLGENLRWKSKEDRASPLEAFRRRGAALDKRYAVLMQPSGQAAIRALMNEKNPVSVSELLDWRNAVKSGGSKKFSLGMPKSLRVTEVEDALGSTGSREKACEVAYLAFESLCADVARVNGLTGGNTDTNAEQGADLIRQRYVMKRSAGLQPATMFEVIMSECQMPTKEMLENRSYLEAAADMFGYTYDEAAALVKKYGVQAWVMMKQGMHRAPEVVGAVKDWAWDTGGKIHDWARLTYAKLQPEVVDDFAAAWKFVVETGKAIGMTVVTKGPGVVEFVFDGSIAVAGRSFTELKSIYDYMITVPLLHDYLKPFLESVARIFGHRFEELDAEKSKKQYEVEEQALVSMFDGGNYPIRDVLAPETTVSAFERSRIKRTDRLTFVDAADKPLTEAEVITAMNPWKFAIAKELFGGAGDAAAFEALKPSQKRYVLEVLQANLFREIGKHPTLQAAIQKFENDRSLAEGALNGAIAVMDQRETDRDNASREFQRLTSLSAERTKLDAERTQLLIRLGTLVPGTPEFQKATQDAAIKAARILQIDTEVGAPPARAHLVTARTAAENASTQYAQSKLDVETKRRELKELLGKGVDPVKIKFDSLLQVPVAGAPVPVNAIDPNILNAAGIHNRRTDLLQNVTIGNSKIFFVPFNWLVGDAEYRAFQDSAVRWKTQRMKNDTLFQEYVRDNKDPKACAAYERYLEDVVFREVFLRVMLTSYGPDDVERQRPLHLSIHEARLLNQYLEEHERLVTFKQFIEVWDSVPDRERDQKLP